MNALMKFLKKSGKNINKVGKKATDESLDKLAKGIGYSKGTGEHLVKRGSEVVSKNPKKAVAAALAAGYMAGDDDDDKKKKRRRKYMED